MLKGIKEVCGITKSYCRKDGRGETVAIWKIRDQIHFKVIPNGWYVRFDDDDQPDALHYTSVPMTMKEIEQAMK